MARDTRRLETFSDGVFAITVTLLILEIQPPADDRNLLHGLVALWPSYLAYAVSFLFIGQVWANHHVMFDHIRAADRGVLLLNTLLLRSWRSFRLPPPSLPMRCTAGTAGEPPSCSTPSHST